MSNIRDTILNKYMILYYLLFIPISIHNVGYNAVNYIVEERLAHEAIMMGNGPVLQPFLQSFRYSNAVILGEGSITISTYFREISVGKWRILSQSFCKLCIT